jgi:serine/threonine protein kinase
MREKSDVYSFGVILLELITDHSPVVPINDSVRLTPRLQHLPHPTPLAQNRERESPLPRLAAVSAADAKLGIPPPRAHSWGKFPLSLSFTQPLPLPPSHPPAAARLHSRTCLPLPAASTCDRARLRPPPPRTAPASARGRPPPPTVTPASATTHDRARLHHHSPPPVASTRDLHPRRGNLLPSGYKAGGRPPPW